MATTGEMDDAVETAVQAVREIADDTAKFTPGEALEIYESVIGNLHESVHAIQEDLEDDSDLDTGD